PERDPGHVASRFWLPRRLLRQQLPPQGGAAATRAAGWPRSRSARTQNVTERLPPARIPPGPPGRAPRKSRGRGRPRTRPVTRRAQRGLFYIPLESPVRAGTARTRRTATRAGAPRSRWRWGLLEGRRGIPYCFKRRREVVEWKEGEDGPPPLL